nr:hypothetical protein CPGR_00218 [Mycolicibacter nonchromogenicus]
MAEGNLLLWLNVTLATGAVLVLVGVGIAVMGGLRKS